MTIPTSGSVAATNGSPAMSEACKGLTPTDAAYKANNCGSEGGEDASGPASGPASGGSSSGPGASK